MVWRPWFSVRRSKTARTTRTAVGSYFFPRNASSFLTFSIRRLESGADTIEVEQSQRGRSERKDDGEERKTRYKMQRYLTKLVEDSIVYGLAGRGAEHRRNHLK